MGALLRALAAIVVSPLLLHGLATVLPRNSMLSFVARAIASVSSLLVAACYGVVSSVVLRATGYGGLSQWTTARAFKWIMWFSTGVSFAVVEGDEYLLERPAVFVGNHQTELDVLMLGCIFPKYCSVTAKKSLKYTPFLGWFMTLSKSVFIDRGNSKTARAAFDGAANFMKNEKQSVYIFPEGTRSYADGPELLPFKKGAFHLAVQAQVPIVPIVVANYSNVLSLKKKIFNSGVVPVKVLPPIPTKGLTAADVDRLTTETRESMLRTLQELAHSEKGEAIALKSTGAYHAPAVKKEL
ncbi:Phospholipid/glycerol acyltransferase [Lasiodiplodia theobromae]|uniref:1-acyl-sn-glycerol-3-phosphate acyltransferase n=1 Tax=Lasiodiplodia theobromae TaxID=45133 RepID=A0A5N5DKV2_9PEZI|nr:1-acylglycerol-3-phosphate acyltransferase [Lasiodiplodia theobromae]KAB2578503.1 putative 1-acyl-sn-glycerol-3-phosphate acyltransferase [Lasiodiplodia theobromae]KAF4542611.1 1-acylglycerol-3-phosphate acyltransferase [Lasiodiplodia theobromae]KAF9640729.1 Phospholipid/glycerol acyltransferase [Lasiodiplodia theobromae]